MASFDDWKLDDAQRPPPRSVQEHELKAAAAPHLSIRHLAGEEGQTDAGSGLNGNFNDFDPLLEQLGDPPIFELGKPAPQERHVPKPRVGACPAAHNRALFEESGDAATSGQA